MDRKDIEIEVGDIDNLELDDYELFNNNNSAQPLDLKSNINPYQTPSSNVEVLNDRVLNLKITKGQAKKIYHAWNNVVLLVSSAVVLFIGTVGYLFMTHHRRVYSIPDNLIEITISVVLIVVPLLVFGTLKKKTWGRYLGICFSIIILPGFPVGTFLGGFGLVGFSRTKALWGTEGISRSELKRYFSS